MQREDLPSERKFFIDNLLVRIHFIIVMIRWTGLAPCEFGFPYPGSLTSTFLKQIAAKKSKMQREDLPSDLLLPQVFSYLTECIY